MKKLLILLFSIFFIGSPSVFADDLYVDFFAPELDFTLSDFCYLQPDVQDREGVYYFPNEEVGITAESVCVFKDAYGQYFSKGKLKKGKFDGKWTFWNQNGLKDYEVNYKTEYSYYDNDQIKSEENYKDGKKDGKSTFWYENGQKWAEIDYKEDMQDGRWTVWYENGQKWREGYWKNGARDGKWTFWSPDGQKSG